MQLPIYPIQEPEIVLQETPSELERQIGVVRRSVTATYLDAYARVQELVSRWIGVEQSVERVSRIPSASMLYLITRNRQSEVSCCTRRAAYPGSLIYRCRSTDRLSSCSWPRPPDPSPPPSNPPCRFILPLPSQNFNEHFRLSRLARGPVFPHPR